MTTGLREAFAELGLPLDPRLAAMLDEDKAHRTERRGCGYTQATRFLAAYVNDPGNAAWAASYAPFAKDGDVVARGGRAAVSDTLRRIAARPASLEARLLVDLVTDVVERSRGAPLPVLPPWPQKPRIGSCSQAEEFFLEIAHGKIRRGGHVNFVVDAQSRVVLVEKMNLGESHSALVLEPVALNGVMLPPGSSCALVHRDDRPPRRLAGGHAVLGVDDLAGAHFLRYSTLVVPPEIRRRAFSAQVDAQLRSNFLSPLATTIDHLRGFVQGALRNAA